MIYQDITRVIDKYFAFMEELDGFHYIPGLIPEDMQDNSRPPRFEGVQRWKLIPSKVTNEQIQEYERFLGVRLPKSYQYFLHYKNFIEMSLGENHVVFFKNLSANWMETLIEQTAFYRRFVAGSGFVPFAEFSDFGVVCFDTNAAVGEDLEYPIVWLDHENGFTIEQLLAVSFTDMFREFEPDLDAWIQNVHAGKE